MNDKHKINQLKNIILFLEEDKKKVMQNLVRVNNVLAKKTDSVNRIIAYRLEYQKMNSNSVSLVIPAVMKNMQQFIKKLDTAIEAEKASIEIVTQEKLQIFKQLETLEKKIAAINAQIEKITFNIVVKKENVESNLLDELSFKSKLKESQP